MMCRFTSRSVHCEFPARRSKARTREILRILLEQIRRGILLEEDPKRKGRLIKRAERLIGKFLIP